MAQRKLWAISGGSHGGQRASLVAVSQWRASFRQLRRRPAFAITALLLLALGIGINTTVFSIIETVLLKPLPYPSADRLVYLFEADPAKSEKTSLVAPVRLEDWNRLNAAFTAIAGYYTDSVTDTSTKLPERLAALRVSPRYFQVYEAKPLLGRTFNRQEETLGGPPVVVIGYRFWARRFNKSPQAIGRRLTVGKSGYTIVGVMPSTFGSPTVDLWIPSPIGPGLARARDARFYVGIGRMKPNVTIRQAQDDLARVQRELGEQYPQTDKNWSAIVNGMKERIVGDQGRSVWLTFSATGLLLLLACANIAGLLLGHIYRRERELAIRASLGATRAQIVATIFREVALIAVAGVSLGTLLSVWGVVLAGNAFATLPRISELVLDWRSVLFASALGVLVLLLIGLIPTLQATPAHLSEILSRGGRTQAGGRHRFQRLLLVAQFAFTVVLLSCAGLLLRSYYRLTNVQTGFNAANVLTFHVGAEWSEDRAAVGRLQMQILSELNRLPNVEAAGITNFLPTDEATLRYQYEIDGLPGSETSRTYTAGSRTVSPGYLSALQIPILSGASCPSIQVGRNQPPKALVNRAFVKSFSQGENLLGKHLRVLGVGMNTPAEITGIVGDVREDSFRTPAVPYVYMCSVAGGWPDPEYVVRARGDARSLTGTIRHIVHELAPNRAVFGVQTMQEHVDTALDQPRLTTQLLALFALAALVLAAFGLYSLTALLVAARTREFGTRIALGARSSQIVAEVLSGAAKLLAVGAAIGIVLAVIAAAVMRSILFGVSFADPMTLAGVGIILAAVCLLAALLPAFRAASTDPIEALRSE
jgi:putative ABC transport system permease protein